MARRAPGPTKVRSATARDRWWCAAVNSHGAFGRWGFIEITDMPSVRQRLTAAMEALYADQPIVGDSDLLDIQG